MIEREDRLTDAEVANLREWYQPPNGATAALIAQALAELQERRAGAATGRAGVGLRDRLSELATEWAGKPPHPYGYDSVYTSCASAVRAILDAPEPDLRGDFAAGRLAGLREAAQLAREYYARFSNPEPCNRDIAARRRSQGGGRI